MNLAELNKVAEASVAPGRGIPAADESSGTIKKRLCDRANRRQTAAAITASLLCLSEAMSNTFPASSSTTTIRQNAKDGTPRSRIEAAVLSGIKVDKARRHCRSVPASWITEGLMDWGSASRSIAGSAPDSPNGAR